MKTEKRKKVSVSGHLQEKRGIYQMILSWTGENNKRVRKSISTGLIVRGNKKKAEDMLSDARREQVKLLMNGPSEEARPSVEESAEETSDESKAVQGTGGLLFADYMETWLASVKPELRLTTYGGHQNIIQRTMGPYFRERNIGLVELTDEDILEFYDMKLETVKATTVHKYHNVLSRVLKDAVEKGLIEHSPMEKVKRPKAERFVGKFLKQSEAIELFNAVKGHKLELGVIFGAYYGLRRSEVVGLRWESINFETNTITIEHSVTVANVDGKKTIVASDNVKSKSSFRTLPLVPEVREKLLSIYEEQKQNRKLCGKAYNKKEGEYIYTDQLGNRIRPDYLTAEFPKFLEANNFKRIRFHDLRHSCASLLLANGVSMKQIQEWLGHSYYAITADTYSHLDFSSKLVAANAMTWIGETSLGKTHAQN